MMNVTTRREHVFDLTVVVASLVVAILFFLGRWKGLSPFVFLGGDGGNLVSFSVARVYPDAFPNDGLLASAGDTAFYVNFHTVWTTLAGGAIGDFGLAYLVLLIPTIFLHLTLYYALGMVLFGNRAGAVLLSFAAAVMVKLPFGEYWGIHNDPQPRTLFSALLPVALIMALRWRDRPELWPVPMAVMGLLTYVHPVSAPPVAGAIWLGLASFYRPEWGWRSHVRHLALAAGAFLLLMAPFALSYFGLADAVADPGLNDKVRAVMSERFLPGFLNLPLAGALFFKVWAGPRILLPAAAALAAWFLWTRRRESRRPLVFFGVMALGLVLIAFVAPFLEQLVAPMLDRLPRLVDFLRASRYLVLVMIVVAVWGGVEWARTFSRPKLAAGLCAAVLAAWIVVAKPATIFVPIEMAKCAVQGRLLCPPTDEEFDRLALLRHISGKTPPRTALVSFVPEDYGLDIRHAALRPVVFSWKDGGSLGYSNVSRLLEWRRRWETFQTIDGDWTKASAFATEAGAAYLILDTSSARGVPREAVCFRNANYLLARTTGSCAGRADDGP